MTARVAVIVNPVAGSRGRRTAGHPRAALARAILAETGVAGDVHGTAGPGEAEALARAAHEAGSTLVVAWGGDGTVNEVVRALAFGPTALGLVRAGSGNGLARALGIPTDPAAALRTALTGAERPIDLGELGGRLFVSVAGLGLDAAVAAGFNARGAGRRGVWPYIRLALEALTTTPARSYTLEVDGVRRDTRALLVACANGPQYGSGARIAPQARLDDGWLDLVVVEDRPALARLAAGGRLLTGTLASAPGVWTAAFTRLEVTAAPPLAFHVDGEVVQSGPHLVARVHPGALRVRGGALLADRSRAGVSRPRVSRWR